MTYNTINDAQTIAGNGTGTVLAGRYRIVRQLGVGGMGSVWLAEDTQLDDKPFAIKMLPSILVSNKRAYRQLKDEALVAMRLVHPNIVQIRAFEENNGNPFLVMDYVDGETLDDYLAEHAGTTDVPSVGGSGGRGATALPLTSESGVQSSGRADAPRPPQGGLPESEVLRILRPIAAALDYAHGEGVVHRDVKPANIMIRKDGHPFILDFGIAREIQETLTRVTGKLSSGTLLYMSPEQLMGEQPKPAQDIYSFAAMAYECLKGEPPFSHGQIEFQIMNKSPEPLPGGPRSVAAAEPVGRGDPTAPFTRLAAGVMAGLAKKPEDRPATCAAVLEGDRLPQSREETAKQSGRVGAPRPPGGPRSVAAVKGILAAAFLVALAGGAWWWINGLDEKNTTKGISETQQTDKRPVVVEVPPPPVVPIVSTNRSVVTNEIVKPIPQLTNDIAKPNPIVMPSTNIMGSNDTRSLRDPGQEEVLSTNVLVGVKRIGTVDKSFVEATNRLARMLVKRDVAYDRANKSLGDARKSSRGFKAQLNAIDDVWKNRFRNRDGLMLREAYAAISAVSNEVVCIATNVEWISSRIKERDAAVVAERELEQYIEKVKREIEKVKREDADIFNRISKEHDWMELNHRRSAASKQIDAGMFGTAIKSFESIKAEFERIFVNAKNERATADRERTHRAFMERLDREGFILDEANNPRRAGTLNTIHLPSGGQMDMVWCPPGWFMMGSKENEEKRTDGETRHAVHLSRGFWIGKYEVTESQWLDVMGEGSHGRKPKREISWKECKDFIRRLNMGYGHGMNMRMPTEAEWEYACRAGQRTPFSFGSRNDGEYLDGTQACCAGKNTYPERRGGLFVGKNAWWPDDVGHYSAYANDWGINDMHGNVREWCEDVFAAYPDMDGRLSVDPVSQKGFSEGRVVRGGCWNHAAHQCRSAFRTSSNPDMGDDMTGFRLVCDNLP